MQVWIDPKTGFKDRTNRPYIEGENEPRFGGVPYDPNGAGFNYGLYDQAGQPSCGLYPQVLSQYVGIGGRPSAMFNYNTNQKIVFHRPAHVGMQAPNGAYFGDLPYKHTKSCR